MAITEKYTDVKAEAIMPASVNVTDHTRVMEAIFANAREVMRNLRPTQAQVLQAALDVDAIDASTKRVIRQTLAALPGLEQAQPLVPPKLRERMGELQRSLLATTTAEQTLKVLQDAQLRGTKSDEDAAWNKGIKASLAIVEDGRKTIYSPAFVDKTLRQQGLAGDKAERASPVKVIAGADAAGAVGGAVGAFVTGAAIPAIPVAAAAGALGASAVAGIGVLLDLF